MDGMVARVAVTVALHCLVHYDPEDHGTSQAQLRSWSQNGQ
jgi:hypothetical protein